MTYGTCSTWRRSTRRPHLGAWCAYLTKLVADTAAAPALAAMLVRGRVNALDRCAGDRLRRRFARFAQQRACVPVCRPAPPQAQPARDQHRYDLIPVPEANELPVQVPRRGELRSGDIDQQDIRGVPHRDLAGASLEPDGIGGAVRGMIEPRPAATAGRIADGEPEGDALHGLGGLDHAERVA